VVSDTSLKRLFLAIYFGVNGPHSLDQTDREHVYVFGCLILPQIASSQGGCGHSGA
jgi:hypothetical protein